MTNIYLDHCIALAREAKERVAERAMMIKHMVTEDGGLMDSLTYVCWGIGDDSARLDDIFSANTLAAIAEHMAGSTDILPLADVVLALAARVRELEACPVMPEVPNYEEWRRIAPALDHLFGGDSRPHIKSFGSIYDTIRSALLK